MENQIIRRGKPVYIQKASGDMELFRMDKLEQSLLNAGADGDTVKRITDRIGKWVYAGVSSQKIYTRAFDLLRKEQHAPAARYRLKEALLEIGPTGYPFEALVGQIFARQGFQVEVGVVVEGPCVTHEMDVIATRGSEQHLAECKYHKEQGKQVSIQVPLYVNSRVEDIVRKRRDLPEFHDFRFTAWVVTNTRFSADSIAYAAGVGLQMLAWDYPNGAGLKDLLEKYRIYPVTILNSLNSREKRLLLDAGIATCSQLAGSADWLNQLGLGKSKMNQLMQELHALSE